ncbi:hypothetical protein NT6N_17380 [Oceaniferula spumae]|uniref:SCP domain-containing protein n=1 Tax=Oceaniferula spumae TaxID=2979115 RepID=A0AAT9FL75_9BACT
MNHTPHFTRNWIKAAYLTGVVALALLSSVHAWEPGTDDASALDGFIVDTNNRRDVLAFYNCVYPASENYAANIAWTGNYASCNAGTTSPTFKDDTLRRVNLYRALVGLPADISFDATKSAHAQEAALMMSAQRALSHNPGTSWACYTVNGRNAAAASNLALGSYGPFSIDRYMFDDGDNNIIVGHRRWILYSRAQEMGTGDVPGDASRLPANSLWVIGNFKPAPTPTFVAWPNAGYSPVSLRPDRWSLSYPGASFSSASVTMSQNGSNVPLSIVSRSASGVGDNTIVWEPVGIPDDVIADTPYTVTVSGIGGGGPSTYSYTVNLFNPNIVSEQVAITGTMTPPTSGQTFTFNSLEQADSYELQVSTASAAAWTESAEDSPTPQIIDQTSPGYDLRSNSFARTGSKSFHLTHPSGVFSDQAFIVTRDILPTSSSQLKFYDRGRFATTTTTLEAEVSTDGGGTWTNVWSRNGAGLSSGNWDPTWISRSINLSAYEGEIIRIRFIMKGNGSSITQGSGSSHGFFIDDITVTNSTYLAGITTTELAGTATSFELNSTTAGSTLVEGSTYLMRVRANIGCRWFDYGPTKSVTAQAPTGYDAWVIDEYPQVTGGFSGDHDGDGISNGVEYAFGFVPTSSTPSTSIPQPIVTASSVSFGYSEPSGITGITYGAEWSTDMVDWDPITDTGSGGNHQFTVSRGVNTHIFIRHKITKNP